MVLLSIFFNVNQIHGGIISRLFFIHFVAPCACSSSIKYYFKSFYEDLSTLILHTSVGYFPPGMPAGPHFVTQPILLSETFLIFDINHQQTQGGQTRLKR